MEIIALDAHKDYSQVCVQKQNGQFLCEKRINRGRGKIKQFLTNRRRSKRDIYYELLKLVQ